MNQEHPPPPSPKKYGRVGVGADVENSGPELDVHRALRLKGNEGEARDRVRRGAPSSRKRRCYKHLTWERAHTSSEQARQGERSLTRTQVLRIFLLATPGQELFLSDLASLSHAVVLLDLPSHTG